MKLRRSLAAAGAATAALITLSATSASANAGGTSGCENVYVDGSGTYVNYIVAKNLDTPSCPTYYGHHHIYSSSNRVNSNQTPNRNPIGAYSVSPNKDIGTTSVCAEGWFYNTSSGSYTLKGRPCVSVY